MRGSSADVAALFLDVARGKAVDEAAVLQRAEALLDRMRARPPADAGAGEVNSLAGLHWQAVRLTDDSGEEEIACWKEATIPDPSLQARWDRERLKSLHVQFGDRFWGVRQTARGELRFSSDGPPDGPAEQKLIADLPGRIEEALDSWESEHPRGGWTCARGEWTNGPGACSLPDLRRTGEAVHPGWPRRA